MPFEADEVAGTRISEGGNGVWGRIEARLDRIEDKLDSRMMALERKVDDMASRQAAMEGEMRTSASIREKVERLDAQIAAIRGQIAATAGVMRWVGPLGIVALVVGFLAMTGVIDLSALHSGL